VIKIKIRKVWQFRTSSLLGPMPERVRYDQDQNWEGVEIQDIVPFGADARKGEV
jgi:hypothetical protein